MKKIVFDTNFLVDLARFKIDIDEVKNIVGPCQFSILDSVLKELEKIADKKIKSGRAAKVALKLIELNNFKIIKSKEKNTDKAILKIANKKAIVATNDSKLRKSLKRKGIKTIYLRKKKKLAID